MNPKKALSRRFYRFYLPLYLLLAALLVLQSAEFARQSATERVRERLLNTLVFQAETLKTSLEKFSVLTVVLARRDDIIELVAAGEVVDSPEKNRKLRITAIMGGISDVWVADARGKTLLATTDQPLQGNKSFKELHESALLGSFNRASEIHQATGDRYTLYSSPVVYDGVVVGLVVVRVNVEFIEFLLGLFKDPILVSDKQDQVLLSNVPEFLLEEFSSSRELTYIESVIPDTDREFYEREISLPGDNKREQTFLVISGTIPLLQWNLHVLATTEPIITQRNVTAIIMILLLSLVLLVIVMRVNRQQRLLDDQRSQKAFSIHLERQVRDRTHALTKANEQLETEIGERRQAEQNLRTAQADLVQAAKMAAIGQMSTTLAHEYNQPLAALQTYTENAEQFLKMQKPEEAVNNLQRIQLLIERLGNITTTLRSFALKSDGELAEVSLAQVMKELVILLSPLAGKHQIELDIAQPLLPLNVMADKPRLAQVLTNLTTNAMDACGDNGPEAEKKVEVSCQPAGGEIIIRIRDTGPGISAEIQQKMFEPFFTTKKDSQGLGLGLFIVDNIVRQMKGRLSLTSEVGYGAVFEIALARA